MKTLFSIICFCCITLGTAQNNTAKKEINTMLDQWHLAAAEANFDAYFAKLTDDAVYIGTDVEEVWDKQAFIAFAKPYFDKGKAWSFTALSRNIYISESNPNMAWFDENLNTQMKVCRGSGVLVKSNGKWYIKHYVLSMTIPNNVIDKVITAKSQIEDQYIKATQKQ